MTTVLLRNMEEIEFDGTCPECGSTNHYCSISGQSDEMVEGDEPDTFRIVGQNRWWEEHCRDCGSYWTENQYEPFH